MWPSGYIILTRFIYQDSISSKLNTERKCVNPNIFSNTKTLRKAAIQVFQELVFFGETTCYFLAIKERVCSSDSFNTRLCSLSGGL